LGRSACRLEIDPLHADTVRLAFKLALAGDGAHGLMGVTAIAKHLNERKLYTRAGGHWGVGTVHRMLTRPTYVGHHEFNKRTRAKTVNPADQVIAVPVPPPIDQATFDAVQPHLKSRNPKVSPPQVVGGRDHLRALAQRVEVAEGEVRIMGSPGNLLRTLAAASGVASAGAVPSFVPRLAEGMSAMLI
jgi:hypothetical protein